jgi:hypothetical protein
MDEREEEEEEEEEAMVDGKGLMLLIMFGSRDAICSSYGILDLRLLFSQLNLALVIIHNLPNLHTSQMVHALG